jgi:hypothetical protein
VAEHSNLLSKWKFYQTIVADPDLQASTCRVAARLLDHHNIENGKCFPSESTIARALGLSVRQVQRCIRELEEKGWIRVTHRHNDSNQYEFCWEKAGVTMKPKGAETDVPGRADLEHIFDALNASRNQEEFERLWAEHVGHLNGEMVEYLKQVCDDAPDYQIKDFVEDLLAIFRGRNDKRAAYRENLPKSVKGLKPSKIALEAAKKKILEKGTKGSYLPEFPEVLSVIKVENKKVETLVTRCIERRGSDETMTMTAHAVMSSNNYGTRTLN